MGLKGQTLQGNKDTLAISRDTRLLSQEACTVSLWERESGPREGGREREATAPGTDVQCRCCARCRDIAGQDERCTWQPLPRG